MNRAMIRWSLICSCLLIAFGCWAVLADDSASLRPAVDLAGRWRFQLDRADVGERQEWFRARLPLTVRLPGSLQEQGYGDEVTVQTKWTGTIIDNSYFTSPRYAPYRRPGNVKVPFWL
ncbi:MAG TPA: beta-glucuronidase, partial [Planctomycetaceae bacterium]|nr:beta-glucuronidase [Planctomycetaceae bacterium]